MIGLRRKDSGLSLEPPVSHGNLKVLSPKGLGLGVPTFSSLKAYATTPTVTLNLDPSGSGLKLEALIPNP